MKKLLNEIVNMAEDATDKETDRLIDAILTTDLDILIISTDNLKEVTDFTTCDSVSQRTRAVLSQQLTQHDVSQEFYKNIWTEGDTFNVYYSSLSYLLKVISNNITLILWRCAITLPNLLTILLCFRRLDLCSSNCTLTIGVRSRNFHSRFIT